MSHFDLNLDELMLSASSEDGPSPEPPDDDDSGYYPMLISAE